ncbi:MAG: Exodeoxyribonuclease 7 small subunit [Glaciecola sp. HTCC2999]|jgi:exodeoxyribonuclease VII small subunit|nr:MAG: Exodeoxyribonuclease 7 small subunit [Glaciecola sp. HTCC2999]
MEQDQASDKAIPNFEQSMQQLEQLVQEMERGELSLDVALAKFQDGIELARACQTYLKDAEQKISILTKDSATLEPMNSGADDADDGF